MLGRLLTLWILVMPAPANTPRIQLLLTGNELMSGDTVDSNSAMIAQRLQALALDVYRKVTVSDDSALLEEQLLQMCAGSDAVIINGGLGPTIDDLTAEILASAAGTQLAESPEARAHVLDWCEKRGAQANAANLKQAWLPEGAEIIPNPIGSAVGFQLEIQGCLVLCTPGVPGELRAMLDTVIDTFQHRFGVDGQVDILRLQTFGIGESNAQQKIADANFNWPAEVDLGFRAGAPQMEIKLSVRSKSDLIERDRCEQQLRTLFGDHIIGSGDTTLAAAVLSLLQDRGHKLTTAESCTGGLIASMLTREPGSSAAFEAGFVTYANSIKQSVLNVPTDVLELHGAVSEPVVVAMAEGAIKASAADYAIAVSGIAGPDGGTEDKPVGTVWLAWGPAGDIQTRCLCWPVERTLFQTMIAASGLDMIRRLLLDLDSEPRYFAQRGR